jgi:hypothetical protein
MLNAQRMASSKFFLPYRLLCILLSLHAQTMRLSPSAQKLLRLVQNDIQQLGNTLDSGISRLVDAIREHNRAEQERYESRQEHQTPPEIPGIRNAIESIARSQKTTHPPHWYKDRTFLVSLAGVLVVFVYTTFAALQWRANKKAADAAKDAVETASRQLEMVDRPWLKDEVEPGNLIFDNGAISWWVRVKVQNVGHSVATEVFPDVRLISIQGADFIEAPRKKVTEICDSMPKRFESVKGVPGLWNNSIFSSDSRDFGMSPILWAKDMNFFDGGKALGKSVVPMLVGCIEYRYPTSAKPHHTGFVYAISHNDDAAIGEAGRVFFSVGKSIPKENLVLKKVGQVAD